MDSSIADFLNDCEPSSVLECSSQPWPALAKWATDTRVALARCTPAEVTAADRTDLALVHDAIEHLPRAQGQQLLGYLRNYLAQRIWLILPETTDWTLSDLIAMGLRQAPVAPPGFRSYTYDISSYNHKRSWNNSKFWANPENFDKYRW